MRLARAWLTLFLLSFRRLLWSINTVMIAFPFAGALLFMVRRNYERTSYLPRAFDDFSREFVLIMFTSFLVPICALAYATVSIGGDREDRTLLFLLIRPVPRPLIFLAKLAATLPLVIGLVTGSFYVYCYLAGPVGQLALRLYLPAVLCTSLAYVSVFHLFSVLFRHATIVALVYALFLEFFLGNLPGIIKRVAVNYYGRSMIFDIGATEGLEPPSPTIFDPVSMHTAGVVLLSITVAGILLSLLIFQRREYHDLT